MKANQIAKQMNLLFSHLTQEMSASDIVQAVETTTQSLLSYVEVYVKLQAECEAEAEAET